MTTAWELLIAGERLEQDAADKLLQAAGQAAAQELVKAAGRNLPRWVPQLAELEEGLRSVLGVSLEDVLLEAFSTWQELREYADPSRHPPHERSTCTFGPHTVSIDLHPKLEVRLNGMVMHVLPFDVELALELRQTQVDIRDGRILELRPGEALARGTLRLGDVTLVQLEGRPVTLPGRLRVEGGLPIPR